MSSRMKISVTCPECNGEHPFAMWKSINTTLNPEMKAAEMPEKFYAELSEIYREKMPDIKKR